MLIPPALFSVSGLFKPDVADGTVSCPTRLPLGVYSSRTAGTVPESSACEVPSSTTRSPGVKLVISARTADEIPAAATAAARIPKRLENFRWMIYLLKGIYQILRPAEQRRTLSHLKFENFVSCEPAVLPSPRKAAQST